MNNRIETPHHQSPIQWISSTADRTTSAQIQGTIALPSPIQSRYEVGTRTVPHSMHFFGEEDDGFPIPHRRHCQDSPVAGGYAISLIDDPGGDPIVATTRNS